MLEKACRFIRAMGCANKLIHILTALRITVFIGAFVYAGVMVFSLLKQVNSCNN